MLENYSEARYCHTFQLHRALSGDCPENSFFEWVGHKPGDLLHVGLIVLSELPDQVWLLKENHSNDNVDCETTSPDKVTQRLHRSARTDGEEEREV